MQEEAGQSKYEINQRKDYLSFQLLRLRIAIEK